jgi:[protein-PII] uridylyltransferase
MLHLLTFVDGQAVGSTTWNEWRQQLVWHLYQKTAHALEATGVEWIDANTQKESLRRELLPLLPSWILEDEIEAHFDCMPVRYWRRVGVKDLMKHFEVLHIFFESLFDAEGAAGPVIRWRHFPDRGYTEVIVCSWDRQGLFAKIAGSFSAARVNILNADIYTRSDNLVLDIFQVCNLDHRCIEDESRLMKMERILKESLLGTWNQSFADIIQQEYESMRRMPLQGEEIFPTSIVFNNDDSKDYTILEIQTPDRLGLLYHILQVVTECGLNIGLAKINTEKGAAMDVFYVTDGEGQKITQLHQLNEIQKKLMEMMAKLNEPFRRSATPAAVGLEGTV